MSRPCGGAIRTAVVICVVAVLVMCDADGAPGGTRSKEPMLEARRAAESVAARGFRSWIESIPDESLAGFGFASRAEAASAEVLVPIPYLMPPRDRGPLNRRSIENDLDRAPVMWLVPVRVGQRIVALVTVESPPGEKPRAIEYGKPWAASRLDAGIRAAGSPLPALWTGFRFVAFASPRVDLLVFRGADRTWNWWRLTGTEPGSASRLSPADLSSLLAEIAATDSSNPFH